MTALTLYVGGQTLVWGMRTQLSFEMAMVLPPLHLSTFAVGDPAGPLADAATGTRGQGANTRLAGERRAWTVGRRSCFERVPGSLVSRAAPYNNGLLAPFFAGFIWALSAVSTPLSVLCGRWLVALGNSSYALYLIHTPMLACFATFNGYSCVYLVYLALCIGLSVLSFHYFETPVRLWVMERFDAHVIRNAPRTVLDRRSIR